MQVENIYWLPTAMTNSMIIHYIELAYIVFNIICKLWLISKIRNIAPRYNEILNS